MGLNMKILKKKLNKIKKFHKKQIMINKIKINKNNNKNNKKKKKLKTIIIIIIVKMMKIKIMIMVIVIMKMMKIFNNKDMNKQDLMEMIIKIMMMK